ncbi:uncharacterized protein LOC127118583 isoform X1 [Lathyrus oleraceus]|uniref:uncharacterized protein LOC127118583 isoform X1 n=1 Tax=Pisum sativum TaxID=3888 RepID=UPI0021D1398A|nr:uncharacterized protein LOC127118583 isoform X1 [Pisum sativum]
MEKTKKMLQRRLNQQESEALSRLQSVPSIRPGDDSSFYEHFVLTGIKVDKVQPGVVSCSFKVPPRLTDSNGKLANGAIATLVDEVGGVLVHEEGLPMNVSVDMSISFLSTAHVNACSHLPQSLLQVLGFRLDVPLPVYSLYFYCVHQHESCHYMKFVMYLKCLVC